MLPHEIYLQESKKKDDAMILKTAREMYWVLLRC